MEIDMAQGDALKAAGRLDKDWEAHVRGWQKNLILSTIGLKTSAKRVVYTEREAERPEVLVDAYPDACKHTYIAPTRPPVGRRG